MKRTLCAFFALFLVASISYAQPEERPDRKVYPAFIPLENTVSTSLTSTIFDQHFELTSSDELRSLGATQDDIGLGHEKFQQYYKGVKVDGGIYTLHTKQGKITHLSGQFMDVKKLNVSPNLTVSQALSLAKNHVSASKYVHQDQEALEEHELVVFADRFGKRDASLAFVFDIHSEKPLYRAYVYVDAHSGEILMENARIHEANVAATGTSLYDGTVNITADNSAGPYRLRQTASGGGVETYDLNGSTNYGSASDVTSGSTSFTGNPTAVQAHYGAEQTYDYYLSAHNRNSYNGTGGKLISYVSYSNNYVNAFWNGSVMTYGDGDGVNYGPLVSLDIAGHEMSHGVTEFSANLVYQRESGALNESFSDIFGEMVEFHATGSNNWRMGTDIGAGSNDGAIRSMSNPNDFNDPDTYGGSFWTNPQCGTPTQSNDYCGVHSNSGVQNKWFYVLAVGESGTNDISNSYNVTGIGRTKAAAIAYRNLTTYLGTSSTFADARSGAIQSAVDLYGAGSVEEIATTNAWYAVGVGGEYGTTSYCNSNGNNVNDEYIQRVQVGTIDNSNTSSPSGGYTDYTSISTDLAKNSSNTITITPLWTGTIYAEGYSVWIDYNQDGDFTDAGEQVYSQAATTSTPVSGSFTVPSSATDGQTRMRVSMKYNAIPTSCESFTYGEVEDYTVNITSGGGGDTQDPSVPTGLASSNITTSSFDATWNASSDNVGVTGYNVYLNGSLDGTTAGTSYSFSGLSAATSYTVNVSAYDAAGNTSAQSSTLNVTTLTGGGGGITTISANFFETGWEDWNDGGSDCARISGGNAYEGNYAIRIRDNTGSSVMTTDAFNLAGYSSIDVEFYFRCVGMENGEDFWLQYNDGSGWTTVATWVKDNVNILNNTFYTSTVTLSSANYNFVNGGQFRFRNDASVNNDRTYIDAVTITGTSSSLMGFATSTSSVVTTQVGGNSNAPVSFMSGMIDGASVYPNPSTNMITVESSHAIKALQVYAVNGALVSKLTTMDHETPNISRVDISRLTPGIYFVAIQTADEVIHKKFMKN